MAQTQEENNPIIGQKGRPLSPYIFIFGLFLIFLFRLLTNKPATYQIHQSIEVTYSCHYPTAAGFWLNNLYLQLPPSHSLKPGYRYHLKAIIDGVLVKTIYQTKYKAFVTEVTPLGLSSNSSFWLFINHLNRIFSAKIDKVFNWPDRALIKGLIFGQKSELGRYKNLFQQTGTIHIVAASGFNVMLVFAIFFYISLLFLPRKLSLITTLVFIWFYAFLISLQPPVLRAVVMASILILSQLFQEDYDLTFSLTLAALIILIYQPQLIFSLSFQLSFSSTLGLILLANELIRFFSFLPQIIREDLAVTVAAQLMTWPLISFYFGRWNLISFLANGAILWTIPLLTLGGIIILTLQFLPFVSFLTPILNWFYLPFWLLSAYLFKVIGYLGKINLLILQGKLNYPLILAYYSFLALAIRYLKQKSWPVKISSYTHPKQKTYLFLISLLVILFTFQLSKNFIWPARKQVRVINQDNSRLLSYSDNNQLYLLILTSPNQTKLVQEVSMITYPWQRKVEILFYSPLVSQKEIQKLQETYSIEHLLPVSNDYFSPNFKLINKDGKLLIKTAKMELLLPF